MRWWAPVAEKKRTAITAAARSHSQLIKTGAAAGISAWNAVLTTYGRCLGLDHALKVFDEMPHRDTVSWNALLAAHVHSGEHNASFGLFRTMMARGLPLDSYALGSLLKSVVSFGNNDMGAMLHGLVLKAGIILDVYVASALLDGYVKCGRMCDALLFFDEMPVRNVVSWNTVITGYARMGRRDEVFWFFRMMEEVGIVPDEATFASMLTLLDAPRFRKELMQLHGKVVKYGWVRDTIVCNSAIVAWSLCGSIGDAEKIFEDMDGIQDLVTWNSMLAACALCGFMVRAFELFVHMKEVGLEPDVYSFTSMMSLCFGKEHFVHGRSLHGLVVKKGLDRSIPISNSLVAMYIKGGDVCTIEEAFKIFNWMEVKDSVSWNTMLTGLSQGGFSDEAMRFFCRMHSSNLEIDHYAFSAALRSCSDLAALQLGMQVHGSVMKLGFEINDFVVSSLIYMYSKSGVIDKARRTFDKSNKDSSVSWNSIIFAYAQHGQGHIALALFSEMQKQHVAPDHITFVGLLSACSHVGLIKEGNQILETMDKVYKIPLRMEHYACAVDLFGRAGRLEDANRLIANMAFEPDATVWVTLLGACRVHGDIELASEIARHLLVLEPHEHSTYVLLSNLHSSHKLWEGRSMIQKAMRERRLSKVPGWSWIEVQNRIHAFNAEDRSHAQAEKIYCVLMELIEKLERIDSDDDVDFMTQHVHLS